MPTVSAPPPKSTYSAIDSANKVDDTVCCGGFFSCIISILKFLGNLFSCCKDDSASKTSKEYSPSSTPNAVKTSKAVESVLPRSSSTSSNSAPVTSLHISESPPPIPEKGSLSPTIADEDSNIANPLLSGNSNAHNSSAPNSPPASTPLPELSPLATHDEPQFVQPIGNQSAHVEERPTEYSSAPNSPPASTPLPELSPLATHDEPQFVQPIGNQSAHVEERPTEYSSAPNSPPASTPLPELSPLATHDEPQFVQPIGNQSAHVEERPTEYSSAPNSPPASASLSELSPLATHDEPQDEDMQIADLSNRVDQRIVDRVVKEKNIPYEFLEKDSPVFVNIPVKQQAEGMALTFILQDVADIQRNINEERTQETINSWKSWTAGKRVSPPAPIPKKTLDETIDKAINDYVETAKNPIATAQKAGVEVGNLTKKIKTNCKEARRLGISKPEQTETLIDASLKLITDAKRNTRKTYPGSKRSNDPEIQLIYENATKEVAEAQKFLFDTIKTLLPTLKSAKPAGTRF